MTAPSGAARRTWCTIAAPREHAVAELDDGRVSCRCGWRTRAATFDAARGAHVRHVELERLLAGGRR